MRVLFSAHGAYGHLLPLIGLARATAAAGHDVLVAVGDELCETTEALGLRAVPAGLSDDALVAEALRRRPQLASEPPSGWAVRMFAEIAAPAMAADLDTVIRWWKPDLVVREEGEYGAAVAAAAAGIPWVTHRWGTPAPAPADVRRVDELVAPLWNAVGLAPMPLIGAAVIDPCPRSLGQPDELAVSVRPTAPTLGARGRTATPQRRPAAYIGFGTVPLYRDRPALVEMALDGLLVSGFATVVVTTPDADLAARLRALGGERVHVTRWVSLPDVLPACDLVIAHGGAGTVLSALMAGVPLLLLPAGSPSQLRMTEACVRRGVGLRADDNGASAAILRAAIDEVMGDHRFADAARAVASEIAAMPPPEQVVPLLEDLGVARCRS